MTERELRRADEIKCEALANECHLLLRECTVEQRSLFNSLFPGSLDSYGEHMLLRAYNLIIRTIKKNRKDDS